MPVTDEEIGTGAESLIALADVLETDALTLLTIVAPDMEKDTISRLALAIEACPVHLCDMAICEDDGTLDCVLERAVDG